IWIGGARLHDRLLPRLVRYAGGFHPLGQATDEELARIRSAMAEAGRDPDALEMVRGPRAGVPDPRRPAALAQALETIPAQVERGFRTFCFKPSQLTDDPAAVPALCEEVVARVHELAG